MNQTAANLRALMLASDDMSDNALSDKTGVPQPTISRILSGESADPRDSTLRPLAKFFGLTVHQLKTTPTAKVVAVASGHVAPQRVTPDEVEADQGQQLLQAFAALGTMMQWFAETRPIEVPLLRDRLAATAKQIGVHGDRDRLDALIALLSPSADAPVRSARPRRT